VLDRAGALIDMGWQLWVRYKLIFGTVKETRDFLQHPTVLLDYMYKDFDDMIPESVWIHIRNYLADFIATYFSLNHLEQILRFTGLIVPLTLVLSTCLPGALAICFTIYIMKLTLDGFRREYIATVRGSSDHPHRASDLSELTWQTSLIPGILLSISYMAYYPIAYICKFLTVIFLAVLLSIILNKGKTMLRCLGLCCLPFVALYSLKEIFFRRGVLDSVDALESTGLSRHSHVIRSNLFSAFSIAGLVNGILSAINRIVSVFVRTILMSAFRVDKSAIVGGSTDAVYSAFLALVHQTEERYNPVMRVAADCFRSEMLNVPQDLSEEREDLSEERVRRSELAIRRRRIRVRNRFWLWITLTRNPQLSEFRHSELQDDTVKDQIIDQVSADGFGRAGEVSEDDLDEKTFIAKASISSLQRGDVEQTRKSQEETGPKRAA
jgi:hypothetical protein